MAISSLEDGRFLDANDRFLEITGYARAELIGASSLELGMWEDPEDRRRIGETVKAQGELRGFQTRTRRKDGSLRRARASFSRIVVDGRPCLLSAIEDVTQQREAEEALERQTHLYEALIGAQSQAGEGVCIVDMTSQKAVFVNDALCRLYGITPEEIRERPNNSMWERIAPEERDALRQRAAARDPNAAGPSMSELTVLHTDGHRIRIEVTVQRFQLDGKPHLLTLVRDVTARRAGEDALRNQGLTRAFARRLLTQLVTRGRVPEDLVRETGRQLADESQAKTVAEHVEAFQRLGLGRLALVRTDGASYTFEGDDLIERRKSAAQPTCHLALSFLEGSVGRAHGAAALGTEVRCQSRGQDKCVFVVSAATRLGRSR